MANPIENAATQVKLRLERARSRYAPIDVVVRVFKRFSETDGGSYSAALTYYMFFSIFPLLALTAAVLGFVLRENPEDQRELFEKALNTFPVFKDALTPGGFAVMERARQELAITGAFFALYSGSGAIVALEHALNKVYRVDDEPNFWQKRLRSLRWLAILGVAFLLSVAITSAAGWAGDAIGGVAGSFAKIGLRLMGGVVAIGVYATAFKFLPAKELSWSEVLPGALVGGVAFAVLILLGGVFLQSGEDTRNATFGAFAAAATLLVVSFLVARVTLLSAEVNAVLAERRLTRDPAGGEQGGEA